jgi:hypothetical protein
LTTTAVARSQGGERGSHLHDTVGSGRYLHLLLADRLEI